MSRLTRDGTAEPVSRDQILRGERGQEIMSYFRGNDEALLAAALTGFT